ncbi:TPA: hypothetical protein N3Y94_002626 [Klebsiella quasipneumoniae]|uniref:hypothetical protein n=1 Tax=Klebsiella quasipneumoniae TaxID=1463165 RepID=UPI000808BE52|nr:hypothetical protein [Klebsiella quasipneumoniae]HBW1516591.1 hypothetical protein [Klebsiella quasipneumoniae subsp. similipneumoniae]MCF1310378.1 hypothetical protein [Klebsiella quasipneumoniae]SBZ88593.1 terminase small subunit [Klebsiella quasipneumoniae]SLR13174.1 terminase small subunit [Klebsiella quasipneumoniae]HCI8826900.1 hypothetical protein [Klebsiella quasipneumoniae]
MQRRERLLCCQSDIQKYTGQALIHAIRNERQKRYAAELDDVIGQLTAIINADPNEISQYRRVNCRYCWGNDHKYQWRDIAEQLSAERKAQSDGAAPPDTSGGIGFVDNADPNPECPRCNGEGVGEPFFADTRDLEGDARYLLQGVKLGKFGIEILTGIRTAPGKSLLALSFCGRPVNARLNLILSVLSCKTRNSSGKSMC